MAAWTRLVVMIAGLAVTPGRGIVLAAKALAVATVLALLYIFRIGRSTVPSADLPIGRWAGLSLLGATRVKLRDA